MQRVCTKCNTLVTTDGSFCPSCGEPLPSAVDLNKNDAPRSVQFSVPAQDAHQGTMPDYGNVTVGLNSNASTQTSSGNNQEMTLGQWVGTVICTTWFGLISLVLCIVWAVSDSVPAAKRRYCQAMLIIEAIGLVVGIIIMIIFFAVFASVLPDVIDALERAFQSSDLGYIITA